MRSRLLSNFSYRTNPVLTITFWALLVLCPTAAQADEISIWNFNDSDLLVDHGAGTLTTDFTLTNVMFLSGSTVNARQGDSAGSALTLQGGTGNVNNGRNITFNVSTAGFSNIIVTFASQRTSTGFNSNQFQYSLDGVSFVNFGAPFNPATSFGLFTFDLSGVAGLSNNPLAAFRIIFNGATTAAGNIRIDNLVVEGTPAAVPEPVALLLLGTGLSGAALRLRRRRRGANG